MKIPSRDRLGILFLVIFAFPSSLRLLLTLHARLLVMLTLTNLLLNTSLRAASFEATQSTVQSLVLFYDYV